ncbi:hypothetical protein LTR35_017917 [Friedmanniomyces endolithicus]|nr:hypothetical protein LTR35_017917 [Friedmanniomyces endolithicus]KAK0267424.1 hypothetical protein LTS00_017796 [Friedmanniomyces endolithicus]KAK0822625.1 hypothetical protein LTR73_009174 [Friedmanniomyces endolithicus]
MARDGQYHDSALRLPPIRSVEQSLDVVHEDEPRDSILQMPLAQQYNSALSVTRHSKRHDSVFQELLDEHHAAIGRRGTVSINDLVIYPQIEGSLAVTTKTKRLHAKPPSTDTLAPGTHLDADSKRWASRGLIDRHFIMRLAANDLGNFRPAPPTPALTLRMLLQAVTAMTAQNKKIRQWGKGR